MILTTFHQLRKSSEKTSLDQTYVEGVTISGTDSQQREDTRQRKETERNGQISTDGLTMASNQYPSGTHYDVPGSHPEYTRDQSGTSEGYMDPHASSDPANVQPHLSNDSHSYPPSGMAYNPDPSYDDLLNEKELANVTNARMSAYSRSTGEAIPRPRNAAGGIGPGGLRSSMAGANGARPTSQWTVGFEPPPKSTGILRMWRKENRASWARVSFRYLSTPPPPPHSSAFLSFLLHGASHLLDRP